MNKELEKAITIACELTVKEMGTKIFGMSWFMSNWKKPNALCNQKK